MKKNTKIEKSKILLQKALLHLLLQKPYQKISIHDLCQQAKVGRSTFYNHYHDKNDLLKSTVDFYSSIAREATVTAFLSQDNMDLHTNLIRDYRTTAQYNHVIRALLSVHLPNADFEANMRQILFDKYQILLGNSQSTSFLPEALAVELFIANALTVTKFIAHHPDTANIEKLANFMLHIYTRLFKPLDEDKEIVDSHLSSEVMIE